MHLCFFFTWEVCFVDFNFFYLHVDLYVQVIKINYIVNKNNLNIILRITSTLCHPKCGIGKLCFSSLLSTHNRQRFWLQKTYSTLEKVKKEWGKCLYQLSHVIDSNLRKLQPQVYRGPPFQGRNYDPVKCFQLAGKLITHF